ncbi:hypothetical protein [Methyloglobulus sp.]|uniref:hypothetical protein n=1 Tax=Methyloglobulus sp. TaxID=2518622 RepID=UPI0032B87DA3
MVFFQWSFGVLVKVKVDVTVNPFKMLMNALLQAASNVCSSGHVYEMLFDGEQYGTSPFLSALNVPLNFVS